MRVSGVPYEVDYPKEYIMEFEFIFRAAPTKDSSTFSDTLHKKIVVSDCATFHEIHEAFLDFLGASYGYDVKETLLGNKDDTNTSSDS